MMNSTNEWILHFLNGDGAFSTARDLLINLLQYLIRFIVNVAYLFLDPILNFIFAFLPFDYNDVYEKLYQAFDYIMPYVSYLLDAIIVPKSVIVVILTSLLFRITIRKDSFVLKLIIAWYHRLKP